MIKNEISIYNNLDFLIKQNASFAIYRPPLEENPVLIRQTQQEEKLLTDLKNLSKYEGFVVAPFYKSEKNPIVCIKPDKVLTGEKKITDYLSSIQEEKKKSITYNNTDSYPSQSYEEVFSTFSEALKSNELKKLVLSRPYRKEIDTNFSPASIFEKALNRYPSAFVYLLHTPKTGTWIGSSPEILLAGKDNKWKTVSLAGTQSTDGNIENITWDDKNKNEQLIVTEYIREQFKQLNIVFAESEAETIKAGKLAHLRTTLSFDMLGNKALGKILDSLHPTPAVCGFPKDKAYKFIIDNEGYDRQYYSGFIGGLDINNRTDLYVNLRCMKVHADHLTLYAGGGLLSSSSPEREKKEIEAKLKTMLSLLE